MQNHFFFRKTYLNVHGGTRTQQPAVPQTAALPIELHTQLRWAGFEPASLGNEPSKEPLLYPAMFILENLVLELISMEFQPILVGVVRFELTTSGTQNPRDSRTTLHPFINASSRTRT